jgi:hypothetical protein
LFVIVSMTTGTLPWFSASTRSSRATSMVALELALVLRVEALGHHEVERLRARLLGRSPRWCRSGCYSHDRARRHDRVEQQVLGHPALVRRDDVLVAEEVPDHALEAVEAAAARVRLVPHHQRGPLPVAHRRGAAVGQKVDVDRVRRHLEQVHARFLEPRGALLARGGLERLDDLDAERFGGGSA